MIKLKIIAQPVYQIDGATKNAGKPNTIEVLTTNQGGESLFRIIQWLVRGIDVPTTWTTT